MRFASTYAELLQGAQALPPGHANRTWAIEGLLDILDVVRTEQPDLIHQAFERTKSKFATRAHEAYYVVSDLIAMSRQRRDQLPFLVGTHRYFGTREILIPIANQYRLLPTGSLAT